MKDLVIMQKGEPYTTSLIVAEELDRTHKSVLQLIKQYKDNFTEFGTLAFEMRKSGGRPIEFAYLNEQHLTFLIMNMRAKKNEFDRVLDFKMKINKQFHQMRKALLQIKVNQQNKEWLESRQQGKKSRKEVTEAYARYLEHAIEQNPETSYAKHPENVYSNFTRMLNKTLFDIEFKPAKGKTPRDFMEQDQLSILGAAELALQRTILIEIDKGTDFKKIYKIAQEQMKKYADIVGKSTVINMLSGKKEQITRIGDKK